MPVHVSLGAWSHIFPRAGIVVTKGNTLRPPCRRVRAALLPAPPPLRQPSHHEEQGSRVRNTARRRARVQKSEDAVQAGNITGSTPKLPHTDSDEAATAPPSPVAPVYNLEAPPINSLMRKDRICIARADKRIASPVSSRTEFRRAVARALNAVTSASIYPVAVTRRIGRDIGSISRQ